MSTVEFHILTTAEYEDDLSNQLMLLGAAAITCRDAGNEPFYEPKPGEYLQWQDTLLIALFAEAASLAAAQTFLAHQQALGAVKQFSLHPLEDINWVAHTQRQFKPHIFGQRLWICPSWETPPDTNGVNIILDPGCAFGTGTHPTTALCLEWLDANIKGNETVIDYGCGSGILAIAALKLGAKHAAAVDYDPLALEVTQLNALQNQLSQTQLQTSLPDDFSSATVDILLANIIAGPLVSLAPRFAQLLKPGGKLVLSGILDTQVTDIYQAYQQDFTRLDHQQRDEWVRVVATKK